MTTSGLVRQRESQGDKWWWCPTESIYWLAGKRPQSSENVARIGELPVTIPAAIVSRTKIDRPVVIWGCNLGG